MKFIMLSEASQTKKDKYYISYMQNLKKRMIEMNLFLKQKQTNRLRNESGYDEGRGGCEDHKFRINNYILLYLK